MVGNIIFRRRKRASSVAWKMLASHTFSRMPLKTTPWNVPCVKALQVLCQPQHWKTAMMENTVSTCHCMVVNSALPLTTRALGQYFLRFSFALLPHTTKYNPGMQPISVQTEQNKAAFCFRHKIWRRAFVMIPCEWNVVFFCFPSTNTNGINAWVSLHFKWWTFGNILHHLPLYLCRCGPQLPKAIMLQRTIWPIHWIFRKQRTSNIL